MKSGGQHFVVETDDANATERVGSGLGERLRPGDVVLLSGELGAGKTTFVRGACRALGVDAPITSPTFAIANRYAGAGGVTIGHLDLYRLDSLDDEDPDLLDDYLGADRVAFIEWAPAGHPLLGRSPIRVVLEHLGGDRRRIEVTG